MLQLRQGHYVKENGSKIPRILHNNYQCDWYEAAATFVEAVESHFAKQWQQVISMELNTNSKYTDLINKPETRIVGGGNYVRNDNTQGMNDH